MNGDLLMILYRAFSPARNRMLSNSDACATADSYIVRVNTLSQNGNSTVLTISEIEAFG